MSRWAILHLSSTVVSFSSMNSELFSVVSKLRLLGDRLKFVVILSQSSKYNMIQIKSSLKSAINAKLISFKAVN